MTDRTIAAQAVEQQEEERQMRVDYPEAREEILQERILKAFEKPLAVWRSAGGIAREAGLPEETVQTYINNHPDLFRISPVAPAGIPLYGLREDAEARRA